MGKLLQQLSAHEEALGALAHAAELAASVRARIPAAAQDELIARNGMLGVYLAQDRLGEARAEGERVLAIRAATAVEDESFEAALYHVSTLNLIARLAEREGDRATCVAHLDDAIAHLRRHLEGDPHPRVLAQLGYLRCERGRVAQAAGELSAARADFDAGIELLRKGQRRLPGNEQVESLIAGVALAYGMQLLRDKEHDAAERTLALARQVFEARRARHPDHTSPLSSLGAVLHNLAMLAVARGRPAEAEALVSEALGLQQTALARDPGSVQFRTYVANHSLYLAQVRIEQGRHEGLDDLLAVVPDLRGEAIDCVLAARLWLQRAAAAAADAALDPGARDAEKERCAERGFAMLDAAVARGFADGALLARDRVFSDWSEDPRLRTLAGRLAGNGR
jgi:tetratricopeptide (TPR) repeat protein